MLNIRNLISFFLFLSTTFILAQTKFESGYFLDKQNKKTICLIKNRKWLESPTSIIYKLNDEGEEVELDASMINEFQINGGPLYKTLTAEFPYYKIKVAQNNPNAEITTTKKTVFLKQVVKGKASLYEYRIGNERVYAYKLDNNPFEVLMYNEYIGEDNRIRTNNVFRNQLYKNVKCGENQNIQELEYKDKALIVYFTSFNNCSGTSLDKEEELVSKKKKSKLSVIIWGGVQRYDYSIVSGSQILEYDKKIVPKIAIELENIFPFNNNKWAVFLSTAYTSHSSEASITDNNGSVRTVSVFELSRIESLLGARHFLFLNDKSSFFIEGGTSFDFDLKANITGVGFSETRLEGAKVNFAVMAGIGFSFNQSFYSRVNYYFDQNILTFIGSNRNKLSRLSLSIGYKI